MPRYPPRPLEEKLAWMRERQRRRQQKEEGKPTEISPEISPEIPKPAAPPPVASACAWPADEVPPERKMLRVGKVAEMLAVSRNTVTRWFADRAVIVHYGATKTTMLISEAALDDWFREHGPKSNSH